MGRLAAAHIEGDNGKGDNGEGVRGSRHFLELAQRVLPLRIVCRRASASYPLREPCR
jgi:hypothetical protein